MNINDILFTTILIPIIIGIFKSEISDFITDCIIFSNRKIDQYGDPGVNCNCYIQINGKFHRITIIEYKFGIFAANRKVLTLHQHKLPDGSVIPLIVAYTYSQWNTLVKASIPID